MTFKLSASSLKKLTSLREKSIPTGEILSNIKGETDAKLLIEISGLEYIKKTAFNAIILKLKALKAKSKVRARVFEHPLFDEGMYKKHIQYRYEGDLIREVVISHNAPGFVLVDALKIFNDIKTLSYIADSSQLTSQHILEFIKKPHCKVKPSTYKKILHKMCLRDVFDDECVAATSNPDEFYFLFSNVAFTEKLALITPDFNKLKAVADFLFNYRKLSVSGKLDFISDDLTSEEIDIVISSDPDSSNLLSKVSSCKNITIEQLERLLKMWTWYPDRLWSRVLENPKLSAKHIIEKINSCSDSDSVCSYAGIPNLTNSVISALIKDWYCCRYVMGHLLASSKPSKEQISEIKTSVLNSLIEPGIQKALKNGLGKVVDDLCEHGCFSVGELEEFNLKHNDPDINEIIKCIKEEKADECFTSDYLVDSVVNESSFESYVGE